MSLSRETTLLPIARVHSLEKNGNTCPSCTNADVVSSWHCQRAPVLLSLLAHYQSTSATGDDRKAFIAWHFDRNDNSRERIRVPRAIIELLCKLYICTDNIRMLSVSRTHNRLVTKAGRRNGLPPELRRPHLTFFVFRQKLTRRSANAKRTARPLQKYQRRTPNIWELP